MRTTVTRLFGLRHLAAVAVLMIGVACSANAAVVTYTAMLDGLSEVPVNASLGSAVPRWTDATAHTMHVQFTFSGLTGTTTASHIHAPTAVAGTGTAEWPPPPRSSRASRPVSPSGATTTRST
jgi:hypothetical protein